MLKISFFFFLGGEADLEITWVIVKIADKVGEGSTSFSTRGLFG